MGVLQEVLQMRVAVNAMNQEQPKVNQIEKLTHCEKNYRS
jgi:hypothetical protein